MHIPLLSLTVVALLMLGELRVSRRNERGLRQRGAIEPPDPVYPTMRWAYPGAFMLMAAEGLLAGPPPAAASVAGAILFAASKALKYWAIASLGTRWTFRVLVLPDAPLVTDGPYRFLRHPNYVAVVGELAGMALLMGARISGPVATVFFSWLMYRRIQAEERALGG